jgi:hypothetical protein
MGAFDDLIPQQQQSANSFADLIPAKRTANIGAPQELSIGEKIVSSLPKFAQDWLSNPNIAGESIGKGSRAHGFAMGAADPVVGAAQLVTAGQVSPVNQAIDAKNAEYEAARKDRGREGFDAARLVGNVAAPANLAIAQAAPINAVSTLGKVAQGARAGAIGGAAAPVLNADDSFLGEKVIQAGAGAVGGAVLTPLAAKAGEAITRKVIGLNPAEISMQADDIMREGVNRLRRDGMELNPQQITNLREQVAQSLQQGKKIDPAAMFRKADFEALGMEPTLGQITRDSAQFSREKNLRGLAGVGDPLLSRMDDQSKRMQELIGGMSSGASDDFTAGQVLMQSLKGVDDNINARVGAAYDKARDHLGRAAPMDSAAFSKQANTAIDAEMLNGALPEQARSILNKITTGEIPFNVNSAVMIDKRFSGLQRDLMSSGNKEGALAVGKLRDALNNAPIADNVGADAKAMFDTARGMARNRFQTQEAIPALKAAADGDVSAQDFMRRFLINGKAEEVAGMAKVLPEEAKQEARRQLGAAIERAAFGQNVAGDKGVAQESLAKFLNQPGMKQKMSAFFSPAEIEQINRISRVAAYTTSFPANNTVNTSNTASAAFNLLSRVPGIPQSIGLLNAAKNAAGNYTAVNSAMKANPAQAAADISPEQAKLLASILGGGMGGVAGAAGTGIGN